MRSGIRISTPAGIAVILLFIFAAAIIIFIIVANIGADIVPLH